MRILRGTDMEDGALETYQLVARQLLLLLVLALLAPLLPVERGKNITANIVSMLFPLKNRGTCMKLTCITPGCFTPVS